MSLAEQVQRVDGGQNAALKAIIEKLGGTVPDTTKIDGYAALVDGLTVYDADDQLSGTTKTAYGLGSGATPDDVFNKIVELFSSVGNVIVGEYTGTGSSTKITFPKNPFLVIIGGISVATFSTTLDSLAIIPSFLGSQSAGSFDSSGNIQNGYVYFSLTGIVRDQLKFYTGGVSGSVNSISLDGPNEEYEMCINNKKYKYFAILGG